MDTEERSNITEQELAEAEDAAEDAAEDSLELQQELVEGYKPARPDSEYNQHVFLADAVGAEDTTKVTYLTQEELGRPLFTVRFMLDLYTMAKHDGLDIIANYFLQKIHNVTNSGMSREGFAMNLNVTQKKDLVKKRGTIDNLKNQKEKRAT